MKRRHLCIRGESPEHLEELLAHMISDKMDKERKVIVIHDSNWEDSNAEDFFALCKSRTLKKCLFTERVDGENIEYVNTFLEDKDNHLLVISGVKKDMLKIVDIIRSHKGYVHLVLSNYLFEADSRFTEKEFLFDLLMQNKQLIVRDSFLKSKHYSENSELINLLICRAL